MDGDGEAAFPEILGSPPFTEAAAEGLGFRVQGL